MMSKTIADGATISKRERGGMFFGVSLHHWENATVIFLIIAGLFALLAGLSTWVVVGLQRMEIAEANARQSEAELKLEQLRRQVAPRQLQREKFVSDLIGQPSAPVEIMYLMDDPECFDLAQQIWRALEDAKWPVSAPKPIPALILSDEPTSMSVGGQPSGVTVVVSAATNEESEASANAMLGKEWIKTPWTVLVHAVSDGLGRVAAHAGVRDLKAGVLRIVVAPR